MHTELKRLSVQDGLDVYEMLQEMPREERGYINSAHGLTQEEFAAWLRGCDAESHQQGLVDGWKVPQTTYWLYADGVPVGMAQLRHFLTDALRDRGGHIGYAIVPSARGRGYGTAICRLMLREAFSLGLREVLITTEVDNEASKAVCRRNGGREAPQRLERCYFWFTEDEHEGVDCGRWRP